MKNSATILEHGMVFLMALANSDLSTLKEIDFSGGKQKNNCTGEFEMVDNEWFNGQQVTFTFLMKFLSRQTKLEKLTMRHCGGLSQD